MKKNKFMRKRNAAIRSVWSILGKYTLDELTDKAVKICLQHFPQADEILLEQFKQLTIFAQEYYFELADFDSLFDNENQ